MKRNNVLKILLGSMALSVVAAAATITPNVTASAAVAEEDFVVIGASVRYDENATGTDDGTGFRVGLRAKDTYLQNADEIGFLLIPSNKLAQGEELDVYNANAVINAKAYTSTDDTADDWTAVADEAAWAEISTQVSYVEGCQVATSYVYGIPDTASEWEITVRGYAKVDGQYVYTSAKTRSMRSVAVAASKDSANSAEMRSALTKYMDAGNVAYLGSQYTQHDSTEFNISYANNTGGSGAWLETYKATNTTPDEKTVNTLGVGITAASNGYSWATVKVKTPAIKDISSYQYMYLWTKVSSKNNLTYRIGFNNTNANQVYLTPNAWTRIVFVNDNGTWKAPNGSALFPSAYSTTATNMDNFMFCFYGMGATEGIRFELTDMYACNELPTITVNTDASNVMLGGKAINVSYTTESFDTAGVTFTNYVICDGVATKLDGTSYTPETAGTYKFVTYAEKDGKLLAMGESAEITVVYEEGNIAYWNNKNCFALTGTNVNGSSQAIPPQLGFDYGTDEYASPMGGTSLGIYAEHWVYSYGPTLKMSNPAIKDVSNYKYLYVWVYTKDTAGVRLIFNGDYYCAFNIAQGQWTRLVFEKKTDGNFYANGSDRNGSGVLFNTNCPATDLSKFNINIQKQGTSYSTTAGVVQWTYFGGFYACNELPALPEGTVDWTKATT